MDGNNIDQMADFVRKETEARIAGDPDVSAAIEGDDFTPPGNGAPPSPPSGDPPDDQMGGAIGSRLQRVAPSPTQPVPPVGPPEIVGVDLRGGIIVTTIGNFELPPADRTKVAKACLRSVKKGFSTLHAQLSQSAAPRPRRGRPPVTTASRKKAKGKTKAKNGRRKRTKPETTEG
jgi:hypothetical protein